MRRPWLATTLSLSTVIAAAFAMPACAEPPNPRGDEPVGDDPEESALAARDEPCDAEGDCHRKLYCARALGACGGAGACQPKPDACIDLYDPVCGCDGVTYSNACFAAMMGTSVKFAGSCDVTCASNADCGKAYCSKPAGACGEGGVCKPKPAICEDIYRPVCGCDGVTYVNACFAARSGASVAASGSCP